MRRIVAAVVIAVALTGCGDSDKTAPPAPTSTAAAVTSSAAPAITPGMSASRIAELMGCEEIVQGSSGSNPDLGSTATCKLAGRSVLVASYKSTKGADGIRGLLRFEGKEGYVAAGDTWEVAAADEPVGEQKTVAETVVRAIGGTVEHVAAS
jgi:hypothetical protein